MNCIEHSFELANPTTTVCRKCGEIRREKMETKKSSPPRDEIGEFNKTFQNQHGRLPTGRELSANLI